MMQFKWNSWLNLTSYVIITLNLVQSSPAQAETEFHFFGDEIDFWHEKKAVETTAAVPKKESPKTSEEPAEAAKSESFNWPKYMDPKNKEFFKEGDYTPPDAFMEIVRNPSDENIKMWFSYMDKKNELSNRLQARLSEYMARNTVKLGDAGTEILKGKIASLAQAAPSTKRYRFRMYFDSHCPHCHKMFQTLTELQQRGYFVEARQVDSDTSGLQNLTIPTSKATPAELQEKKIQSVPLLLVGDLEKKVVYRLSGYQTVENVFSALERPPSTGGSPTN